MAKDHTLKIKGDLDAALRVAMSMAKVKPKKKAAPKRAKKVKR